MEVVSTVIVGRAAWVISFGLGHAQPGDFIDGQVQIPQDLVPFVDELVQETIRLLLLKDLLLVARQ